MTKEAHSNMLLVTLTADIGAAVVLLLTDGSVRKPTFDGALHVVTEQCKYSTLDEQALNITGRLSIRSEELTVCMHMCQRNTKKFHK